VTIKELARRIFVKAQRRGFIDSAEQLKFSHRPIYEDDVRLRIPAIEKAQRALGWAVTIKLDDALDRCIDAVGRPAARAVMERGSYSTPDGL
jgi:nucleoside-diphosphate-sugar epimerase